MFNSIHKIDGYDELISVENIFRSWKKFRKGKSEKQDVAEFERNLEDNLFSLAKDLKDKKYFHSEYSYFSISDPKKRDIYKAKVRDRIVHQVVFDYLEKIYGSIFIEDSFSSRKEKGTHKSIAKLKEFSDEIIKKNHGIYCAMKCDIKKYFESINHRILKNILAKEVSDKRIFRLVEIIIDSFKPLDPKGIPLGNITSQIFANIYLNELDEFVKRELKLKYYLRYNDDFVILGNEKRIIMENAEKIKFFVENNLLLEMPESKMIFRKLKWGVDFCGSVIFPKAILLREKTEKIMMKNIEIKFQKYENEEIPINDFSRTMSSYFGLLKHCKSYNLKEKIRNEYIYAGTI